MTTMSHADSGAATAEFAVVLPAVAMVAMVLLCLTRTVTVSMRCQDAASAVVRELVTREGGLSGAGMSVNGNHRLLDIHDNPFSTGLAQLQGTFHCASSGPPTIGFSGNVVEGCRVIHNAACHPHIMWMTDGRAAFFTDHRVASPPSSSHERHHRGEYA